MTRYRLSRAARADIDDIWTFTRRRWSEAQAERYVDRIRGTIDDLRAGRVRARPIDDVRSDYLSLLVGSHVVLIRSGRAELEIVRILHQSMDLSRHLK